MADNWYEIMELSPGASPADIKKQYHFLCKVWHPDRFSGDSDKARAEEKVKRVNVAYEVTFPRFFAFQWQRIGKELI